MQSKIKHKKAVEGRNGRKAKCFQSRNTGPSFAYSSLTFSRHICSIFFQQLNNFFNLRNTIRQLTCLKNEYNWQLFHWSSSSIQNMFFLFFLNHGILLTLNEATKVQKIWYSIARMVFQKITDLNLFVLRSNMIFSLFQSHLPVECKKLLRSLNIFSADFDYFKKNYRGIISKHTNFDKIFKK